MSKISASVLESTSIEEGECSSDDEITGYTPIQRPTDITSSQRLPSKNTVHDSDSDDEGPLGRPDPPSDSDSDEDRPTAKKRNIAGPWGRRDAIVPDNGNNETFKRMAAAFQAERKKDKKKNNVWGSILQEDTLNKELSGIGVKRTIKELNSDRGAEAYDYNIPAQIYEKERQRKREEIKQEVDEMSSYWADERKCEKEETMEEESVDPGRENELPRNFGKDDRRGTKRSLKERLGKSRLPMDRFHGQELSAPGQPKHLIDVSNEDFLETSDKEFAKILADRLGEEKPELIEGVVSKFGKSAAHQVYKLTQRREKEGGIEINNGARRRTSGGVFLFLLKTDTDTGLNTQEVKKFLADAKKQEDRKILEAKSKKKNKDFTKEMEDFLSLRKELKVKQEASAECDEMEESETGEEEKKIDKEEPLLDMGTNPFASVIASMKSKTESTTSFKEPNAPPNSVEATDIRNLQEYDDDLFAESENIELL